MDNPTESDELSQEECAALGHEFEVIDEGGVVSEFQPPDPAIRKCILCGFREQSA